MTENRWWLSITEIELMNHANKSESKVMLIAAILNRLVTLHASAARKSSEFQSFEVSAGHLPGSKRNPGEATGKSNSLKACNLSTRVSLTHTRINCGLV
jgi:hypothetical protein